jgi:hypothetical protein
MGHHPLFEYQNKQRTNQRGAMGNWQTIPDGRLIPMLARCRAMSDDHQRWHWGEGAKFAVEGIKSVLLLNGGAGVALLAFYGNAAKGGGTTFGPSSGFALLSFGTGALLSALAFLFAYLAQLQYGKAADAEGSRYHAAAYGCFVGSAVGFLLGLIAAWFSLP